MFLKSLFHSFVAVCFFSISGCATDYNPDDWYDRNAVKKPGRIAAKKVVHIEERSRADRHPGGVIPIPVGGTLLFIPIVTGGGRAQVPIYEYQTRLENGDLVSVISEYPAHEVGECVNVFLSAKPTYPRIAQSGCP